MSPLGGALLGLLTNCAMSGYEHTKVFDATLRNVWSAQHSQIYPELARLLGDGLIEKVESGPRRRKRYATTAAGREALVDWLRDRHAQMGPARDEGLLRAFFLGLLDSGEAEDLLLRRAELHRRRLEAYEAEAANGLQIDPDGVWTGGLVLELGIRYEQMMLEWTRWALDELNSRRKRGRRSTSAKAVAARSS